MKKVRLAGTISTVTLGLALAGCSVSPASNGNSGGGNASNTGSSSSNSGGGGAVTFNVTVNFTGVDPVQGSFTDSETGSGVSSCLQYATLVSSIRPFHSPAPPMQQQAQIQGKTLAFQFTVSSTSFHGAGTYPATIAGGVSVGSDEFTTQGNSTSSVTVNGDGSGMASFANYVEFSGSGQGTESGTVTWTCSG